VTDFVTQLEPAPYRTVAVPFTEKDWPSTATCTHDVVTDAGAGAGAYTAVEFDRYAETGEFA
jgi:hypothetical protein